MSKEYTYDDVIDHTTKKDLLVVIHDKVYNASDFVDEHPGGEEVLLDVGGQDATEAFEDVGHSDEAREILDKLQVGVLKRGPNDAKPKVGATDKIAAGPGGSGNKAQPADQSFGFVVYALVLIGGLVAFLAYQMMQGKEATSA